jgi:hypothetical protein
MGTAVEGKKGGFELEKKSYPMNFGIQNTKIPRISFRSHS